MSKSFFEENGGTYRKEGNYYLPNLTLPDNPNYNIGIWGRRRLDYLKSYRKGLYTLLLTSGKLANHLHEIDVVAHERRANIICQMAAEQGVTEQLKAENQMLWVGCMNNICACVDEIIRAELIYV